MIKWLCNKIMRLGREYEHVESGSMPVLDDDCGADMDKSIRFAILPARGGCVFEIRKRDIKTHERETITHIIPEGHDVANAVGKIVAMEILRY